MMRTPEQIELETERLKAEYGGFFESVAEILFRHDPIGINFEHNWDEYHPEVRTILHRLRHCHSAQDLTSVVHEEFTRWFGPETAGPREKYQSVSEEIWNRWQEAKMN